MLSHRIDYGHLLVGAMARLVSDTRRLVDVRQGGAVSDLEDWVAILAEYETGATGVLESSKLTTMLTAPMPVGDEDRMKRRSTLGSLLQRVKQLQEEISSFDAFETLNTLLGEGVNDVLNPRLRAAGLSI